MMCMAGRELKVTVSVTLDSNEDAILSILSRYPSRALKVSTLRNVMQYEEIDISAARLRDYLGKLVVLGIVIRQKGNRTDRYSVSPEYIEHRQ